MPDNREPPANRISHLRKLLVDPLVPVHDKDIPLVRNAALSLLSIVGVTLVIMPFNVALGGAVEDLIQIIPNTILLSAAYWLARRGHVRTAIWIAVVVLSAMVWLVSVPIFIDDPTGMQIYFIIPLAFAGFFLKPQETILVALAHWIATFSIPLMFPTIAFDVGMVNVLVYLLLMGTLFVAVSMTRRHTSFDVNRIVKNQKVRLDILLEFVSDAVIIHREGIIQYVNDTGVKLIGADHAKQVVQETLNTFIPERVDTWVTAQRVQRDGQTIIVTNESLNTLHGKTYQVTITASPIIYQDDLCTQLIVTPARMDVAAPATTPDFISLETVGDLAYKATFTADKALNVDVMQGPLIERLGFPLVDLKKRIKSWDMFHPEDIPIVKQHIRGLLNGNPRVTEFRVFDAYYDVLWLRDSSRPVVDEQNKVTGVSGVVQDVTERLESEVALRTHALRQAVVAELGQRAMRPTTDLTALFNEVLLLISQVLEVPICRICEAVENEPQAMRVTAEIGWSPVVKVGDLCSTTEDVVTRTAINRREPIMISDYRDTEGGLHSEAHRSLEILSGISVVMVSQSGVTGLLEAHDTHPRNFSMDDVNFLQALGNILAAFVERQRFVDAESQQRMTAEALSEIAAMLNQSLDLDAVLEQMLDQLNRILPHDAVTIMLIEHDIARVIRHRGHDRFGATDKTLEAVKIPTTDDTFIKMMLETGNGVIIPDVREVANWVVVPGNEWIRSYAGAPIITENEHVGIINVDSATVGTFNQEHLKRLQAFANQAGIAIRNARRADMLEQSVRERTRELELQRVSLQTILNGTGEGIFYAESGIIRYVNDALTSMTGYNEADLVDQPVTCLLAETSSQQWQEIVSAIRHSRVIREGLALIRQDGSTFDAGLTISKVDVEASAPRTVTLVRDISREKALDEQKSRFIATASHELRSPASSLNTRIYLMRRAPEKMDKHLDILERIAARMNGLIEDLLDISRFEKGVIQLKRRHVILQQLMLDTIELVQDEAREKSVMILSELSLDEPTQVYVDPDRFAQVINNLVTNAIHYTPSGGTVTVRTFDSTESDLPYTIIEIEDTGIGISPEDRGNIFQPFFRGTTMEQGTGLGLSISKDIVQMHGGKIEVESELGAGSTFSIKLPIMPMRDEQSLPLTTEWRSEDQ